MNHVTPCTLQTNVIDSICALMVFVALLSTGRPSVAQESTVGDEPAFLPLWAEYQSLVQPFLDKHCLRCHGPDDAQGEFRTDTQLSPDLADLTIRGRWNEVVNSLNGHLMPPEGEPQPEADSTARIVDWITSQMIRAEQSGKASRSVMRRLNRAEYKNTVRDLVGIELDVSSFPQDPPAGGFDNNGHALSLSAMQLELYYQSAEQILDAALVIGDQPPKAIWRVQPESGNSDSNRVQIDNQRPIVNGGNNPVVGDGVMLHHANWDRSISFRDFHVLHPGSYTVRIRAAGRIPTREEVVASASKYWRERVDKDIKENPQQAKWKEEEFDRAIAHFRQDRIYDYGPPRIKVIQSLGGQPRVIAEFDIDASIDAPQEYSIEAEFSTQSAGLSIEYAYDLPKELENFWLQSGDDFARPQAWIDWIELEGPNYESWPTASHKRILFDSPLQAQNEDAYANSIVKRFMQRAFRRPVSDIEVSEKIKLFHAARREGASFQEAIRLPLSAILVSPHFLFLVEQNEATASTDSAPKLSPYELACRLSYFLWSTMPDDELFRLARQNKLADSQVLREQVSRMIEDPKSEGFVENFASQWLGLREIGANPPAADLYRKYDRHLEISMREESLAFFREILHQKLSARNFLRSDFVAINERLARFYGIDGVRGDHFRRVEIPEDVFRGGLLTQASVLTITSNGTRTSPVKRGTWILKNILGSDPGLPVANVGEISPNVPGIDKATVRQRLEIHRELPQCARCHNKIDPLGFALENFNASGEFRLQEGFGYKGRIEKNDPLVDASSQLPDGTPIDGIRGLQRALIEREDQFYFCLASKMLTYALGRELSLVDHPTVKHLVHVMKTENASLQSLIQAIVITPAFQTK
jgi:hypothetical protein